MSYGQFLVVFLVIPIVGLAVALRQHLDRRFIRSVAALAAVAILYTTPWDNAIVAMGVWSYDPSLIAGVVVGYLPLEEYLFFIFQTILTSLIVAALVHRRTARR